MGELLRLNPVAGFIWKQLDAGRSVEELAKLVSAEFSIDRPTAEQDVEKFLRKLIELEIVEAGPV